MLLVILYIQQINFFKESALSRLIAFIFFFALLCILVLATLIYLQEHNPRLRNYFCLESQELAPYSNAILKKCEEYEIPPWGGIALVFAIVGVYLLGVMMTNIKRKERRKTSYVSYIFCIVVTFALSAFCAIYYWPSDTIRLGNFLTLQRGPREVFLNQAIYIGVLVATFHLFIFLLMNLHHCLFYRPQEKHYPRTYDN